MYGIFTYIYHKNQPNVGTYTINTWIVWVMKPNTFIDLLVVEPTHLKVMLVKMGSSSTTFGVEIPKIFETTT